MAGIKKPTRTMARTGWSRTGPERGSHPSWHLENSERQVFNAREEPLFWEELSAESREDWGPRWFRVYYRMCAESAVDAIAGTPPMVSRRREAWRAVRAGKQPEKAREAAQVGSEQEARPSVAKQSPFDW